MPFSTKTSVTSSPVSPTKDKTNETLQPQSLTIATGKSRKETKWKNEVITWGALITRLTTTQRTHETVAEYFAKKKDDQDNIKDIGGFVGGALTDGRRKNGHVKYRSLLTLDVDFADGQFYDQLDAITKWAMVVYSTHKHTPKKPRLRLIIPLNRTVSPEEYEAIGRRIAADYGIDSFDPTTFEPTRLMYWPSTPKDGEFYSDVFQQPFLDADAVLARYDDWKDPSYWPEPASAQRARKAHADKQGDPMGKPGIVGAFCRTYTISDAIATFLSDVYTPTADGRYTYVGGSTSGGLVVYEDKFAYSHHSTDPIGSQLCNAFDLVRIHKYGAQDPDTPGLELLMKERASFQSMVEFARLDANVVKTIGMERIEKARNDFAVAIDEDITSSEGVTTPKEAPAPIKEDDYKWLGLLAVNQKGGYYSTLANLVIILENDPLLKDAIAENTLRNQRYITKPTPWKLEAGDWGKADESGLRHYLEVTYGIYQKEKTKDAINIVAEKHAYHPVRDYLNRLEWDGKPRIETLLIDYLGAEDSKYVRAITRKTFVAAVKRVFEPGCKFDQMLTIIGKQGIGKSLLVAKMGQRWYSDTIFDMKQKEAFSFIQGVWIMEMGELASLKKTDRETIKGFISKQEDYFRKPYAEDPVAVPRQCIFIGTTNEREFLNDPSGNRRFWVVDTNEHRRTKLVWDDLTQSEVDQLWAECVHLYRDGENIMALDQDILEAARAKHEEHSIENPHIGMVDLMSDQHVSDNWDELSLEQRRAWLSATEDFRTSNSKKLVKRERLCARVVWCEGYGKDQASLMPQTAALINEAIAKHPAWDPEKKIMRFGDPYGRQKGYERKPSKPINDDDLPF